MYVDVARHVPDLKLVDSWRTGDTHSAVCVSIIERMEGERKQQELLSNVS